MVCKSEVENVERRWHMIGRCGSDATVEALWCGRLVRRKAANDG